MTSRPMTPREQYRSVGEALRDRIVDLIPEHPEIMDMDDPWPLFKVEGFDCSDLSPSLFQASWALNAAKHEVRAGREREHG